MSKLEKIEKLLAQARRLAGKNQKLQKYIRENVVDVDISPTKVSKLFEKGDKLAKQKDMLNALPMNFDFEAPSQKTRDERVAKLTSKKTLFVRYKFKLQERFKVADDEWTKWYIQTHVQVTSFVSASTDLGSIKGRIIEMARALSNVVTPYYESKFIKLVHYAIIDRSRFIKKVDITRLRMKRSTPLKLDWIPEVDNISLACTDNKCVEAAFEERYSKARRPKTAKDLYKYCNEYYVETYITGGGAQYGYKFGCLDAENGYDCRMLAYACDKMDITFMCFDTNHKLLIKQLSKNQNLPPWVFYCVDEHMYMITDKKTLETIVKTNADRVVSSMFHIENEDIKELSVSEFTNIDQLEVIKAPSIVIVQQSELSDIFRDIIMNTDCVPMVKNKGERTIKEIIYTRKDKQKVYIQCDANNGSHLNYKDIQGLCEKLDIPFVNQGMGTLIRDYYGRFIRPNRKKIDRQLFFEKHGRECVTCGCVNSPQIDHIIALANGGADDESNFQVLCKPCHYAKTKNEKEEGYIKIPVIESSFNNRVREIFDSDLMKKWAFVEKLGDYKSLYGYDINKCRKNILYYSEYEWPVFSVMDDVAKFDGDIRCGFYYIESSNLFPLHGNGWYTEPMIKYCLELNIIDLSDIKYQIVSVLDQINADYFRPFIDLVYNTFGEHSKIAINAMIGCFYRKDTYKTFSKFTRSIDEACYLFTENKAKFATYDEKLKLYQILSEETIKFDETEAPIYLQVLDIEAIEAHKLAMLVGKASFVKTDCIYSENYLDIQKPYNEGINYDYPDGTPKYKYETVKETNFEVLPMNCRDDTNHFHVMDFNTIKNEDDYTGLTNEQKDALLKTLACKMLELGSFNIDGRAGTGKSYLIKAIKKELDENNKGYVCLAPTNKAARNIDGLTIHKFIGGKCQNIKNMNCRALRNVEYIIIDEISMVSEIFYKVFLTVKRLRPEINFIIAGDFAQLKPVKDRADFNYKNSRALYELCMGNRLELTKCRRSDDILFNLCKDVENIDIESFGKKECARSICFTNRKRIAVNKVWMDIMSKGKKWLDIKKFCYDPNSQDMKICIGTPIIARVNCDELEISNNDTFEVVSIKNGIKLDSGLVVDKKDFARLFNVAYCITVHKSQGETIKEDYTIYEWNKFDSVLKYVSLSRGICKDKINIIA